MANNTKNKIDSAEPKGLAEVVGQAEAQPVATATAEKVRVRVTKNGVRAAGVIFAAGATPRLRRSAAESLVALGMAEIIGV